jgi:hypothetical protein
VHRAPPPARITLQCNLHVCSSPSTPGRFSFTTFVLAITFPCIFAHYVLSALLSSSSLPASCAHTSLSLISSIYTLSFRDAVLIAPPRSFSSPHTCLCSDMDVVQSHEHDLSQRPRLGNQSYLRFQYLDNRDQFLQHHRRHYRI